MTHAGTVVDSSVLLDAFTEDPLWLDWSEQQLVEAAQRDVLILNDPRSSPCRDLHPGRDADRARSRLDPGDPLRSQ